LGYGKKANGRIGQLTEGKFKLSAVAISKSLASTMTSPVQLFIRPQLGLPSPLQPSKTWRSPYWPSQLLSSAALGNETLYIHLPDGEWTDPYGRARPLFKWDKTPYGLKQADREYYEEVFHFVVNDLGLQASIAASGLLLGGNRGEANGILFLVYIDDIMIIATSVIVASIASRLYQQLKAAGHDPVPDTFQ